MMDCEAITVATVAKDERIMRPARRQRVERTVDDAREFGSASSRPPWPK